MNNPISLILLFPAFIALYYVIRGQVDKAFLLVYLPVLIVLPNYYSTRVPHAPPITTAEAAIVPIAFAVLFRSISGWRPSRVDLWVFLFMCSLTASEVLNERVLNDGIFTTISNILDFLLPYIVGRLLIEPNLRLPTAKKFVVMILLMAPISLYELRLGSNPYSMLASILHLDQMWTLQMRGGRARVAVSFSDAELAGIAFTIVLALNWWLTEVRKLDRGRIDRLGKWFSKLQAKHIPGLVLFALLLLTQSRGPWLGAMLAFAVLVIPRFKNTKVASIVVAILLIAGGFAVFSYLDRYTSQPDNGTASEQQASAAYRRLLLENYKPLVEQGGWLGWGFVSRPKIHGQESIDNQFLLMQLQYGRLGLILFVLIGVDTCWRLIKFTWVFKRREDLCFAFCLLAAMVAVWSTIASVFLGEQLPQITFLLIGWSQSLREGSSGYNEALMEPATAKFSFKRVFA